MGGSLPFCNTGAKATVMCFGSLINLINLTFARPAFGRGGLPGPPAMTRQALGAVSVPGACFHLGKRKRIQRASLVRGGGLPVLKADEKGRQLPACWSMRPDGKSGYARPDASM